MEIVPYSENHISAVNRFNSRLKKGGASSTFPDHPTSKWLPKSQSDFLFQEYFLVEDVQEVRGGYILKYQDFVINGEQRTIADYQLPLSEGIVSKKYNLVGLMVLIDALKRADHLFALGMGGMSEALPVMLKRMDWSIVPVPFYFQVRNGGSFVKNIEILRRRKSIRIALDFLLFTGVASLGAFVLNSLTNLGNSYSKNLTCESVNEFDDQVDKVWERAKDQYTLIAVRDQRTLSVLYPRGNERFHRLLISENRNVIGWVVVIHTKMTGHKQFGNMHVGTIVDLLSIPGFERKVLESAWRYLKDTKVDLMVSNQLDLRWGETFKKVGFFSGPSNFALAMSPKLSQKVSKESKGLSRIHMNRGDGDGPINL